MTETYVSATSFRSHIAQITNCVAWRHDRVVVTRHGQEIGGYVCHEDMEFLRRYKPLRNKVPSGDVFSPIAIWDDAPDEPQQAFEVPPPPDPETTERVPLPDPWKTPYEEVKALYEEFEERQNESTELMGWFGQAYGRLRYYERLPESARREEDLYYLSLRSGPPCCTESTPGPAAGGTASPT
ncbi:MAG: hypothetical protein ABR567_06100 [Myxococcales bacterium]